MLDSVYANGNTVVECPQECSNYGKCITMHHAALDYGPGQDMSQLDVSDIKGPLYTNWEAKSLMMCVCDWGVFGPECEARMCPKGFDPLLRSATYYREINVTTNSTAAGSSMNGTYVMSFNGFDFEFNANASLFGEAECEAAWESLHNVEQVVCFRGAINQAGGATYNIKFLAWPAIPMQNNIFSHEGNPPLTAFTCDVSDARVWSRGGSNVAACHVEDVANTDIREYQSCSGRGTCDFATGSCSCYANFEGVACDSSIATIPAEGVDVLLLYATDNLFQNTLLKLDATANPSDSFNFLEIVSGTSEMTMFTIEGDGDVTVAKGDVRILTGELSLYSGLRIIDGGASITTGGLRVLSGGTTINEGGLKVVGNTLLSGNVLAYNGSYIFSSNVSGHNDGNIMEVRATQDAFAGAVLEIGADRNRSDSFDLFRVTVDNGPSSREVFAITGQGRTTIKHGGLTVTGAAVVKSGGLLIEAGGITITSGGLTISNVGITSTGSITITTGSITASSGTLTVAGVQSSGAITGSTTLYANGIQSTAAITAATSVYAASITSAGGVTASSYTTTSDGRYKTNVTSLRNRAARLLELNGVSFQWRGDSGFDKETHFGFIAQEVELVFPEIVRESSFGIRSLQLEAIAPLLVEAFRALHRRLTILERRLR